MKKRWIAAEMLAATMLFGAALALVDTNTIIGAFLLLIAFGIWIVTLAEYLRERYESTKK